MSTETQDELAFRSWLTTRGAVVSPAVGLRQFSGMGRGAVALEDIEADTLLFSLPRTLLLTTSTSRLPSLLPPDSDWSGLSGWTPLILCMMYESLHPAPDAASNWSAYFNLLPTSFDSLMFWSPEELKHLEGSMVLGKVGKEEADEEFNEIVKPLVAMYPDVFGPAGQYTLEGFHKMGSWILSRSFHVESGKEGEDGKDEEDSDDEDEEDEEREDVADVAMVPMADLLNAKSGADNARLFYEPLTLNMMSTAPIKKGEQIFNTYAEPPNSDLLRRYGHVDEVNEADLVEIGLELVVDLVGEGVGMAEEEREERAEFLLECGIDDTFSLDKTAELPDELISTIRAFLSPADAWAKCVKKEQPPKPRMDLPTAEWALKVLQKRQEQYPTSIEQDEELLKGGVFFKGGERERMAVIVRLEEKRILAEASKGVKEYVMVEIEEKMAEEDEKLNKGLKAKRRAEGDGAAAGAKKKRAAK